MKSPGTILSSNSGEIHECHWQINRKNVPSTAKVLIMTFGFMPKVIVFFFSLLDYEKYFRTLDNLWDFDASMTILPYNQPKSESFNGTSPCYKTSHMPNMRINIVNTRRWHVQARVAATEFKEFPQHRYLIQNIFKIMHKRMKFKPMRLNRCWKYYKSICYISR